MFRRKFLQTIGAAILGTAITLKIPDILIPQIKYNKEIWPDIINDLYFTEIYPKGDYRDYLIDTPYLARLRD